ncbi:MAG: endolytic transglycosylase MltG [Defluviitaleaceae bacterium]|nr:endolytic transglycosylase MltG [Defluviitaleaceae bacterium]
MKMDRVVNIMMYLAGMAFNLALMALVAFLVLSFFNRGFNAGRDFADDMVSEGTYYEREFHIPEDASASEIARRLEEEGIIHNRWLFQLELFLRGASREFSAGTYVINLSMNNVEINRALRVRPYEAAPHEVITIAEGTTIREMAEYFEERGFFTAERFIYVAQYEHFSFSFLLDVPEGRPNRLEGYLFPDTYFIPVNPSPSDIIIRMLHNFDQQFTEDFHNRLYELEEAGRGMSIDEVIIKASIIERETRLAEERALVSQVIHNRLAQNMLLQMCSTVKYLMDDPPLRLLNVHLAVDTPYNTYMHAGLPVGPIANPGAAAIQAALWPAATDYLFFVLRDEATGAHHFSRTMAEHYAARDRYLD